MDLASDVESAMAYLRTRPEIDPEKIGLIGHSEGGIIAPMVASGPNDVRFIVLLAGTGIRGDKLLLKQQKLISKASGATRSEIRSNRKANSKAFEMVINASDPVTLKSDMTAYVRKILGEHPDTPIPAGMTEEQYIDLQVEQVTNPWMVFFLKYDPSKALEKVICPVLAINGGKDLQVPPEENLTAIRKALEKGGNKQVTVRVLPGLNHLFQECETGSPNEYAIIEQTFSPVALEIVGDWIWEQVK